MSEGVWATKYAPTRVNDVAMSAWTRRDVVQWLDQRLEGRKGMPKALLLMGPAASGKSALIKAYAAERQVEVEEAGDVHNCSSLRDSLLDGPFMRSLVSARQVWLYKALDGYSASSGDAGAGSVACMRTVVKLLRSGGGASSKAAPVVFTAQSWEGKHMQVLREAAARTAALKVVHVHAPSWADASAALWDIAHREGVPDAVYEKMQDNFSGDLRQAIYHLQVGMFGDMDEKFNTFDAARMLLNQRIRTPPEVLLRAYDSHFVTGVAFHCNVYRGMSHDAVSIPGGAASELECMEAVADVADASIALADFRAPRILRMHGLMALRAARDRIKAPVPQGQLAYERPPMKTSTYKHLRTVGRDMNLINLVPVMDIRHALQVLRTIHQRLTRGLRRKLTAKDKNDLLRAGDDTLWRKDNPARSRRDPFFGAFGVPRTEVAAFKPLVPLFPEFDEESEARRQPMAVQPVRAARPAGPAVAPHPPAMRGCGSVHAVDLDADPDYGIKGALGDPDSGAHAPSCLSLCGSHTPCRTTHRVVATAEAQTNPSSTTTTCSLPAARARRSSSAPNT